MLTISIAILNFTDLHDAFCEVCGNAGLVQEFLELLEQLKKSTPEFDDKTVCLSTGMSSLAFIALSLELGGYSRYLLHKYFVGSSRGTPLLCNYFWLREKENYWTF